MGLITETTIFYKLPLARTSAQGQLPKIKLQGLQVDQCSKLPNMITVALNHVHADDDDDDDGYFNSSLKQNTVGGRLEMWDVEDVDSVTVLDLN